MRAYAWVVVCFGLAGCETPQETLDEVTCTTICRCVATLPGDREECVTDCVGQLGPVSEECSECVSLHAEECSSLLPDCNSQCFSAQPQPFQGGS
jgi:hypothetical protein